jgi:hypothetical protein
MLHLGPGASRKRVPPSPDVPSGNTLGSITRRSHKSPTACSPRASTIPGSLSLASSDHHTPHGQAGGGSRPPGSAPLHRRPPRRPPPPEDAPRRGLRHRLRSSARASGPPRLPSRSARDCASGTSFVSSTSAARAATSGRYGVKCCPRHSRRFLHSLSVVPCSLVVPAGSLDPAPCGGKEHLSVLRSQNPVFTGFAKDTQQPAERGTRSNPRVPGEVGWASMVQAVIRWRRSFVASIRREHSTPAIPRPWPQRRGVSQNSSPHPARPHPRSKEASG